MRSYFLLFLLFITVPLFLCKEKPLDHAAAQQVGVQQVKDSMVQTVPVPFAPPVDSQISQKQILAWKNCNMFLDSLTFRYADSFKTADPVAMLRYQDDFMSAQDKICVHAGLSGGYPEYKWIMENLGAEKNRAVLQSVNAHSF